MPDASGTATLTVVENSSGAKTDISVQFNPQSLRLHFQASGSSGTQTTSGTGSTQGARLQSTGSLATLSMELLFDTSVSGADVRNTTWQIAQMVGPTGKDKNGKPAVPLVRFHWGTFKFVGTIQSMDETLDLFSPEGKPLRSTVALSMAQVDPPAPETGSGGSGGGGASGVGAGFSASASASLGLSANASFGASASVGITPLTLATAGDSLQGLTAQAGVSASWKSIASANGVDNPRLLGAGAVINLNARASTSLT